MSLVFSCKKSPEIPLKSSRSLKVRTLKVPENTGAHIATVSSGIFSVLSVSYFHFQDYPVKVSSRRTPDILQAFSFQNLGSFSAYFVFFADVSFHHARRVAKGNRKISHKIAHGRSWAFACVSLSCCEFE